MPVELPYNFQNLDISALPNAADSSGDIIGKSVPVQYLDANFQRLANVTHAGSSEPTNPYPGMVWLDTSQSPPLIKVYSGTEWISRVSSAISTDSMGYVENADKVDGFHASQTPAASTIPVSLSTSRIASGWIPEYSTYSRMTCGTSRPSSPSEGELFYHTNDKTLEKYINGAWYTVDWQTIVKASSDWIANRLRISSNQLQVSPNGTNWYDCIPAIGASAIELSTVDNTNFNYKYFILPSTTAILKDANHVPIVFTRVSKFEITTELQGGGVPGGDGWVIRISDVSGTAYCMMISGEAAQWTRSGVQFGYCGDSNTPRSSSFGFLTFSSDRVEYAGMIKFYATNYGIGSITGYMSLSSTAYWIGTVRNTLSGANLTTFFQTTVRRIM